jgi:MoxR-like ATPase
MTDQARGIAQHLQEQLGQVIFGAQDVIQALAVALIGRGHVLLEGPPGLGKTLLSKTFASVLGGEFKRIQGTADLLPTDMTGVHVFNAANQKFEFQQGPLFADVVLVDEINRAGPKTQSALLEAMEERQVSVDRESFALSDNFLVVATQNPREFEGTYPLPESQLDRFMLCVPMSYPEKVDEAKVLEAYNLPNASHASELLRTNSLTADVLQQARTELESVHLAPELVGYVLDIAVATRSSSSVSLGLSTRGALALARCARVVAALRGGDYVIPDDVQKVAPWVVVHRLLLTPEAAIEGLEPHSVMQRLLESVAVPGS